MGAGGEGELGSEGSVGRAKKTHDHGKQEL